MIGLIHWKYGKFKYYMLGTSSEKMFFEFGFKMSF